MADRDTFTDQTQCNLSGKDCYIKARAEHTVAAGDGWAMGIGGDDAVLFDARGSAEGRFRVTLDGYAVLPVEEYKSLVANSRPWWWRAFKGRVSKCR